ncbi:MAG: putative hydro-lyase [Actinomycetes bacterium]
MNTPDSAAPAPAAAASAPAEPTDVGSLTPAQARALFRGGASAPTSGWCTGYAQANLIALPRELAFDFLLFAQRNPKPCPILDVLEAGQVSGGLLDGDIRTDIGRYRVYEHGELVASPADVTPYWRDDLVAFLIGCSFTFEHPLLEAGIGLRHIDAGSNVAMYSTSVRCRPAGALSGPLVVSMRPIPAGRVADAVRISSRYPAVHGAPVHVGDPAALGISDLGRPDFGDPVEVRPGEVPVFWACGVTPQAMVMEAKPDIAICHAPGHMLITDARDSAYAVP